MSIVLQPSKLSNEQRKIIKKMLTMQPKDTGFFRRRRFYVQAKDPIQFYYANLKNDKIFLPYTFGNQLVRYNVNSKKKYPTFNFQFTGSLYDDQKPVASEALMHLKEKGTTTLGLYPGFGKCLAPGTEILMFDGSIKKVEDVQIGDTLMGDDSTPRHVFTTCSGMDEMYEITSDDFVVDKSTGCLNKFFKFVSPLGHTLCGNQSGVAQCHKEYHMTGLKNCIHSDKFVVNGSHILTLFNTETSTLIDIELSKFMKLPQKKKNTLCLYYTAVDYHEKTTTIDPYLAGQFVGQYSYSNEDILCINMYNCIHKSLNKKHQIEVIGSYQLLRNKIDNIFMSTFICNSLRIRKEFLAGIIASSKHKWINSIAITLKIHKKILPDIKQLIRSFGSKYDYSKYDQNTYNVTFEPNHDIIFPDKYDSHYRKPLYYLNTNYNIKSFKISSKGKGKYYGFTLDGNGRFLLKSHIVTHNTIVSAHLSSCLHGLTMVIYTRTALEKQWFNTYSKFTDAKIWTVGNNMPDNFNVILCMDTRIHKIPVDVVTKIKCLIIDEAHMFCTPGQVSNLLATQPSHIIACSATLNKRKDGMQSMIHAMCGLHGIFKSSTKPFVVYKLLTGIDVQIDKNKAGDPNWSKLVKDLAFHPLRNAFIIDLIEKNTEYKIIVLTWSKPHAFFLKDVLRKRGISVDVLAGNKNSYNDSRVLVGTISKIGTGFDEATFCSNFKGRKSNMMILSGSTKDEAGLEQFTGRVFRADFPVIIDLVDNNHISKNHWRVRQKWYYERGGKIQVYQMQRNTISSQNISSNDPSNVSKRNAAIMSRLSLNELGIN